MIFTATQVLAPRPTTFARGNGASGITSKTTPLTLDQIRKAAPSIFAEAKHDSRSDRYTYIPTSAIVEYLASKNFGVFSASQSGSKDEIKRGFTKHMIRFREIGQTLTVGGSHPEMVLINSHDGTSAYRLTAGLFRLVCSNGLIVSSSVIDDIRVHHKGNILEDIGRGVMSIADQLPKVSANVKQMEEIILTPNEQGIFARAALSVKYEDESPITAEQALAVRRADDRDPTLWNTLNRVQETLIKGGDRYRLETPRGVQRRRTNPTNSVDGQSRLNRAVWQLAEEMRKLKS